MRKESEIKVFMESDLIIAIPTGETGSGKLIILYFFTLEKYLMCFYNNINNINFR